MMLGNGLTWVSCQTVVVFTKDSIERAVKRKDEDNW